VCGRLPQSISDRIFLRFILDDAAEIKVRTRFLIPAGSTPEEDSRYYAPLKKMPQFSINALG
jgi:hypothetical protein